MADLQVTADRVKGWNSFLGEFESVLNGDKLIPHWRIFTEGRGINLKRMSTPPNAEPGNAASGVCRPAYLETGTFVQKSTANTVSNLMGGGLIGYFIWFS